MKYLKLLNYQDLMLLAFMQIIIVFGFLNLQNTVLALANWQFVILILATICIAGGGYLIYNINLSGKYYKSNQNTLLKDIPESVAYNLYLALTTIGVGIGFYLCNTIQKPNFFTLFVLYAAILYSYATNLKNIPLLKNIIIAVLFCYSILIINLLGIYPITYAYNYTQNKIVSAVLLDFSVFIFSLVFIKDIIKDCNDFLNNTSTNPTIVTLLGSKTIHKTLLVMGILPIGLVVYYTYRYLFHLQYATVYIFGFVLAPLLYFYIQLITAKSKIDYYKLDKLLQIILYLAVLSIFIIGLNIKYYVA